MDRHANTARAHQTTANPVPNRSAIANNISTCNRPAAGIGESIGAMKLIPCPACEHSVSPEAPFCPGCGHPLPAAHAEVAGSIATPGEVCMDCPAPATQQCCECEEFCCVRHATFFSSKYHSGFYCPSCAEIKNKRDHDSMVGYLILVALFAVFFVLILASTRG